MSDLTRKLHQLQAADFKPTHKQVDDTVVVTLNAHGKSYQWTFRDGSKVQ